MVSLDLAALTSAWSTLTEKQRKSLLSQLNSFVYQNTKNREKSRPIQAKPPLVKRASRTVTNTKRQRDKRVHRRTQFVTDSVKTLPFGSDLGNRHSPPKIGSDGVPIYGRTLISRKALDTLRQKGFLKASAGEGPDKSQLVKT
jgi:hypothetical protein